MRSSPSWEMKITLTSEINVADTIHKLENLIFELNSAARFINGQQNYDEEFYDTTITQVNSLVERINENAGGYVIDSLATFYEDSND